MASRQDGDLFEEGFVAILAMNDFDVLENYEKLDSEIIWWLWNYHQPKNCGHMHVH